MTPRVAVVVPHYRQAQYLKACLDSLLAQTRLPDEIVVCDDASTDATGDIVLEGVTFAYPGTDRQVRGLLMAVLRSDAD